MNRSFSRPLHPRVRCFDALTDEIVKLVLTEYCIVVDKSKKPESINSEGKQTSKKADSGEPQSHMKIARRFDDFVSTVVFLKEGDSRSSANVDLGTKNQNKTDYCREKTKPGQFDYERQAACPGWCQTLGKGNGYCKRSGRKCTDLIRELVDGGHVVLGRIDYFFYIHLGWWHEWLIAFKRPNYTPNIDLTCEANVGALFSQAKGVTIAESGRNLCWTAHILNQVGTQIIILFFFVYSCPKVELSSFSIYDDMLIFL